MSIESSEFIAEGSSIDIVWSRETSWYYLVRYQVGGRVLLRKSLKTEFLGDSRLRETLRKEYEIGCILCMETDYVVRYYQMVDTQEECYLTMDFIEGNTLEELLQTDPDFLCQRRNFERSLMQFLEGLRVIHNNQVVHLDLKPSNIMFTSVSHDIRIIDLGFCYSDAYPSSMGMTTSFAAPEVLDGSGDVDARTDIYSLGLLIQWIGTHLGKGCQWNKTLVYKKLISRCLNKNKSLRWQNVDEIIDFIEQKKRNIHRIKVALSSLILCCFCFALYYVFQLPVTSNDHHALYGHFSIFDGTCEAVGKILNDEKDPLWQGNLYLFSEVEHWGRRYVVTGVADNAYQQDTSFYTVNLPTTLTRIGDNAFRQCSKLIAINIPEGVQYVGASAFWRADSLRHIQLPSTLTAIHEACFHGCAFTSVTIPEGVTLIDLDAFAVCPNLSDVHLPQSLKKMGRGVFWRCNSLETISLPANLQSIGEYTFQGCTKLKQIENHAIDPQPVMSLFSDTLQNINLYVPSASVDKYKNTSEWNRLIICELPEL